jgi:hypothetical protein
MARSVVDEFFAGPWLWPDGTFGEWRAGLA